MDTLEFVLFCLLFGVSGYFVYEMFRLKSQLEKQREEHKKALAEAGSAITDALRSAFDNIKTINQKHERLNKNVKEIDTKLQTLIFHERKILRQKLKNVAKDEKSDETME